MKQFIFLCAVIPLFASCSNEDSISQGNKDSAKVAVATFTGYHIESNAPVKTRTTATHERGDVAKVFWDTRDRIWVKDDAGNFQQSEPATFPTASDKTKANFSLATGQYNKFNPEVRYVGVDYHPDANTVRIAYEQTQYVPNDFSHLGEAGDCGIATAKGGGGDHEFTLQHKSSYLCFLPRREGMGASDDIRLEEILVTANKPIAGLYDFSDGSLVDKTPFSSSSNTITLKCSPYYSPYGFPLAATTDITKNGAYIVIAPGTYNLKISYTLRSGYYNRMTITKTLDNFTCPEGKIRDITANLTSPKKQTGYYLWDAKQEYWYNHWKLDGEPDLIAPAEHEQQRWYHKNPSESMPYLNVEATFSCKDCPNPNELCWYAYKGDPHWDETGIMVMVDGEQKLMKGLWLRKKSAILTYLKNVEHYPAHLSWADLKAAYWSPATATPYDCRNLAYRPYGLSYATPSQGRPANTTDYFFLPAMGFIASGSLSSFNEKALYWSSSSGTYHPGYAWHMLFDKYSVIVEPGNVSRQYGGRAIAFE